jgi:hypothetical protein
MAGNQVAVVQAAWAVSRKLARPSSSVMPVGRMGLRRASMLAASASSAPRMEV